jgi:acyl homoserine lactone synthase
MTIQLTLAQFTNLGSERRVKQELSFKDGDLTVEQIVDESEKKAAYRLRHSIFCRELKWVLDSTNGMESDEYDEDAVFFGVYDEHRNLVSFLRLILSNRQFMMEKVFLFLVKPSHRIRKEADTAEISRLCVASHFRTSNKDGNFGVHKISLLLFKAVYQWCKLKGIRYLYAVTELKVYRLYCLKGFPYRMIGHPEKMPDGVTVVAVRLDWDEFEHLNAGKRLELLNWFKQSQTLFPPMQSPQHEPYLRHSAFA